METIKLKEIRIENIKNIAFGQIDFVSQDNYLNTIGIYGQNGSGKTTLVECLDIIDSLIESDLSNKSVKLSDSDKNGVINIIIEQIGIKTISYSVEFKQVEDSFEIVKERIANIINGIEDEIITYDREIPNYIKSKYHLGLSNDVLTIINKISSKNKGSFLFNPNFLDAIKDIDVIMVYLYSLRNFSLNLKIYHNTYSSLIRNNHITLPFLLNNNHVFEAVIFDSDNYIPIKYKTEYEKIIKHINYTINQLFPNLTIEIIERDIRLGKDGLDEIRLELISNRDGKKFSIIHESDGIKKIITIITYLIYVYNNESAIVVVDEMDAHIYEYLLGELIEVICTGAKGQLIFTSHNLRVLEKLNYENIVFTTNNKNNRFIKLKDIDSQSNLRDIYLRSIVVGNQDNTFYTGQGQGSIRLALIQAGEEDEW